MIGLLKKNIISIIVYACIITTGVLMVSSIPKFELHTWINSHHSSFLDTIFKNLTFLGDGWFAAIISVTFLFINFRYAIMFGSATLGSGFLVQFLKRIVFSGMERPASFLEFMPDLPLVSGVDLHHHLSFPSGHTTTAFAIFILAGLICSKRWMSVAFLIMAFFIGLSRVYISQHFLEDIIAGSFIGLLSALFFYWYFQRMNYEWLNKSILRLK